jgi:hypothetical protein
MAWGSARPRYSDGDEGKKELGWGPHRREWRSTTIESWEGVDAMAWRSFGLVLRKEETVELGAQPTEQKGRVALTDEICNDGAASSEETARQWCSANGELQGPKTGSGAVAELLQRRVASRDDLLEETDGGRWPAPKGTMVSTMMEAALWRRGGGAQCLRMSCNRGSGVGCPVEEEKKGLARRPGGSARPAATQPRQAWAGDAPASRMASKQGRGSY